MSLVSEASKPKVILGSGGDRSAEVLVTPRTLFPTDFPSTAELMPMPTAEMIRRANPFDASFGKANRLLAGGIEGLEQAAASASASGSAGEDLFLKLPTSLNQSPSIFSNISLLGTSSDGNENTLKTADVARLVQQMKESGGLSTQNSLLEGAADGTTNTPRTADVLNAVLDMHSDRLHLLNYMNAPSLFNLPTPAGSAPNSAGVLGLGTTAQHAALTAAVLASVASSGSALGSPLNLLTNQATSSSGPASAPGGSVDAALASPQNDKKSSPKSDESPAASQPNLLSALQQASAVANSELWDSRDIKPVVNHGQASFEHEDNHMQRYNIEGLDESKGPRSNESGSSRSGISVSNHAPSGRGRGRQSLTADMAPDERRMTILERNKAAAVRYRKRKKEEHDEMIGRVHIMEQEKMQLATQNQVLRREVDRLNAILKDRETRCMCLRGVPIPPELREQSQADFLQLDILNAHFHPNHHLINGLHMNPKRHKGLLP